MRPWWTCLPKHGGAKITSEVVTEGERRELREGTAYALAAYTFWGVAPVYFVWVEFAGALEVLSHRIVWSVPLLALLVLAGRQWRSFALLTRATLLRLAACAVLLSINWLTFIYGVQDGRIAETSLGYFINPLVTIVLGAAFLGERMRPLQWVAVGIAFLGVAVELVLYGSLPWIALSLALTFGFYGLLRKQVALPAALALGLETLMVAPIALAGLIWLWDPSRTGVELAWLALGGFVTVFPLVCFGAAATRLPLTILGFFQYLAPTLSLLIAVSVFDETVTAVRWFAFAMVWVAVLVFTAEGVINTRGQRVARQL